MWRPTSAALRAALFLFALGIAACGGGGTSVPASHPTSAPGGGLGAGGTGVRPSLSEHVNFSILVPPNIPPAKSASRALSAPTPQPSASLTPYISGAIASITIQLLAVNNVSLAYPPPAATTQNISCPVPANGCTVNVATTAASGTNLYYVTTYSKPGGITNPANSLISAAYVVAVVNGGTPGQVTLGGPNSQPPVIAKLAIAVQNGFQQGVSSKSSVIVSALDRAGATIVSPYNESIAVTATAVTLSGPSCVSGTCTLTGPQSTGNEIIATYDGKAPAISINAITSITKVPATPYTNLATPAPTPTPPPNATPTPTPSPFGVYVVNAGNTTVVEFQANGGNGQLAATPRRVISGTVNGIAIGCPSVLTPGGDSNGVQGYGFGLSGIAVDSSTSTVYFGQTSDTCPPVDGNTAVDGALWSFGPTATANTNVSNSSLTKNIDAFLGSAFLPTNGVDMMLSVARPGAPSTLTYVDLNQNLFVIPAGYSFVNIWPMYIQIASGGGGFNSATTVSNVVGVDPNNSNLSGGTNGNNVGCAQITDASRPFSTTAGCAVGSVVDSQGRNAVAPGNYFAAPLNASSTTSIGFVFGALSPAVSDPGTGTTYQAVSDLASTKPWSNNFYDASQSSAGSLAPGTPSGNAVIALTTANNTNDPVAIQSMAFQNSQGVPSAQWLEGPHTLLNPARGVASMAIDPQTHRLFVLNVGSGQHPLTGYAGLVAQVQFATLPGPYFDNGDGSRPDLCTAKGAANAASAASSCGDGDAHYYITVYQLPFSGPQADPTGTIYPTGAIDQAPIEVIGGDSLHLPPVGAGQQGAFAAPNLLPMNALSVYDPSGHQPIIFLSNPIGALCDSTTCGPQVSTGGLNAVTPGEVDVFDGNCSGYFNNGSPGKACTGPSGSVFVGCIGGSTASDPASSPCTPSTAVMTPAGVAGGPPGTVTMTAAALQKALHAGSRPQSARMRYRDWRSQRLIQSLRNQHPTRQ